VATNSFFFLTFFWGPFWFFQIDAQQSREMDAFWSGDQQGGFSEGLLLRSSGRLIKGWVWGVHPQLRNGLAVSPLNPSLFYLNQQTEVRPSPTPPSTF
jgi:hypothetical protein